MVGERQYFPKRASLLRNHLVFRRLYDSQLHAPQNFRGIFCVYTYSLFSTPFRLFTRPVTTATVFVAYLKTGATPHRRCRN